MAKIVIVACNCLCELEIFTINGINADYDDFGSKYDHDRENAEDYCCGDMRFEGDYATDEILEKYNITLSEYNNIVKELEEKLSFGSCGLCS